MRRTLFLIVLSFSAATLVGCSLVPSWLGGSASTSVDSTDPVVIVEQETKSAVAAIDAFLQVDDENRVYMRTELPAVHELAQKLRREAPDAIKKVRALTKAFKEAPATASSNALDKTMLDLKNLASIARKALQDYGVSKASASTRPS